MLNIHKTCVILLQESERGKHMLNDLGKFLKKLRVDEGEVLADMAGRLGVSPSYLSAIENGKRALPDDLVKRLCEEYELSDDMIFELVAMETIADDKIILELPEDLNAVLTKRVLDELKIADHADIIEMFDFTRERKVDIIRQEYLPEIGKALGVKGGD
jgi:transcriptional regulator with XRE-family HTH domain